MGKFYSVKEAAAAASVSPDTILRIINNKKLKASRVSNRWRISEEELKDYLARNSNIKEGAAR